MYNNIGKKIKGLAKATFIIVTVICVLAGIGLMLSDEDLIAIGILTMIICPLIAWISSWVLYGFGELVDKVCDIELNTRGANIPVAPVQQTPVSAVSKLDELREKGLITDAEYQQALAKQQH